MSNLPAPVEEYIRATNAGELAALLDTFADHALVNDQLREYWNKPAIAEWAAREVIEPKLTMDMRTFITNGDQVAVTANVDGNFDKRGLPDPLAVAFYFSLRGDKIVQLLILRNDTGA
jgi:hypothetical protein